MLETCSFVYNYIILRDYGMHDGLPREVATTNVYAGVSQVIFAWRELLFQESGKMS